MVLRYDTERYGTVSCSPLDKMPLHPIASSFLFFFLLISFHSLFVNMILREKKKEERKREKKKREKSKCSRGTNFLYRSYSTLL